MRIYVKPKLAIIFLLLIFSLRLNAQVFEKMNGPYGGGGKVYEGRHGVLFQLLEDQNKVQFILFRSVNSGDSWQEMPALPASFSLSSFAVGYDGNLYNATDKTLFKSTDDGLKWDTLKVPDDLNILAVNALTDGTILIADLNRVLRSTNNGQDWQESPVTYIDDFFYNNLKDLVYAINDDSLFMSKDRGLTWKVFYAGNFGFWAKDMLFLDDGTTLVSGGGFIWKFNASGKLIKKLDPDPSEDRAVDMAISSTGRLFAFEVYKSYYSDNLGDTWVDFQYPDSNGNFFGNFKRTSNGYLFGVKDGGGLFRSIDGGIHWNFSAYGMNMAHVLEMHFITESQIVALTYDGLFYSENGGSDWTYLADIFLSGYSINSKESRQVQVMNDEIYYSDFNNLYYFENWKSNPQLIHLGNAPFFDGELFINHSTGSIFFTHVSDFLVSRDKGINWKKINLDNVQDMLDFPNGTLIATTLDGIYRSSDDGEHWYLVYADAKKSLGWFNKIMGNGTPNAFVFYQGNNLLASNTIDNGLTWNIRNIDLLNNINLKPEVGQAINNLNTIFMINSNGSIYNSINFGHDFKLFSDEFYYLTGLKISPNQRLYVFTSQSGLYRSISLTSSTQVLKGRVFKDDNLNCNNDDSGNINLADRLVVGDNGSQKVYAYTNEVGTFLAPITNGDYTFNIEPDNQYWSSCSGTITSSSYNFKDTFPLGLQINSLCPFMEVELQHTILRRCFESTLFIEYKNSGTQVGKNVYIDVAIDPFIEFVSSATTFNQLGNNSFRFFVGDVAVNGSGSFTIKVKISCNSKLGQIHCVEAHIHPDSSCIQTSQAIIRTNSNCVGDSIDLIITNAGNKSMSSSRHWSVIDLAKSNVDLQPYDEGTFFLDKAQVFTKRVLSKDKLLFSAEQDDSYPYNKISKTEIISCSQNPTAGAPPLNINSLDQEEPYVSKFCDPNTGSIDPNEIKGFPDGISDNRYIDKDQQLEYVIRFQNTGTDTAFSIRIENTLPRELDIASLSVGASSHPYQFILSPDRKLIFSFSNILLPDSNRNEKSSHGFIQYNIKPIEQLSNGTRILNDALIYFDFNNAVATNQDLHTIGVPIAVKVNQVGNSNGIDFQIEPNPMSQSSSITINGYSGKDNLKLSCLDLNSKPIWDMNLESNRTAISKADMIPGVYFLVLKSSSGIPVSVHKLLVE